MLSLAHIGLASSFDALLAGWLEVVVRGLVDRRFDQQTNFSAVPTWRLPQHMNLMLNIFADSLQASPTVLTLNIYKKDILSGEKIYLQKYICRPLTPPPPSPSKYIYIRYICRQKKDICKNIFAGRLQASPHRPHPQMPDMWRSCTRPSAFWGLASPSLYFVLNKINFLNHSFLQLTLLF